MLTTSVNHARAMRIAEIIADFRNIQHFLASIRTNPSADEYNEEAYIVLRQCAANAHALLAQPFNPLTPSPQGDEEAERSALQQSVHNAASALVPHTDCENRIILDASLRRFKAQQIYLRASAALRWVASRHAILGGQQAQPVHQPALQQILNTLRAVSHSGFHAPPRILPYRFAVCALGSARSHARTRGLMFMAWQVKSLLLRQLLIHCVSRQELSSVTMERVELSLRSMDTSHRKWMAEDPGLQMIQHMIQSGR